MELPPCRGLVGEGSRSSLPPRSTRTTIRHPEAPASFFAGLEGRRPPPLPLAPGVATSGPSPTDLGFTRDRIVKCASRLQPTCEARPKDGLAPQGDGRKYERAALIHFAGTCSSPPNRPIPQDRAKICGEPQSSEPTRGRSRGGLRFQNKSDPRQGPARRSGLSCMRHACIEEGLAHVAGVVRLSRE
jgi:hypothetical protein